MKGKKIVKNYKILILLIFQIFTKTCWDTLQDLTVFIHVLLDQNKYSLHSDNEGGKREE